MNAKDPRFEFQDRQIKALFPEFVRERDMPPGEALWRGHIRPRKDMRRYTVSVWYRLGKTPKVWVREVVLSGSRRPAPHLWADNSLCLFKEGTRAGEWKWQETESIAHTLLYWTSHWLLFYELWLDTDRWWGPEAPHR